jgi:hypothetical protein
MFLDGGRFLAVDFEHQEVLFEFLVINSSSLQTLSRDFEKRVEGRDVSQEFREETNKTRYLRGSKILDNSFVYSNCAI